MHKRAPTARSVRAVFNCFLLALLFFVYFNLRLNSDISGTIFFYFFLFQFISTVFSFMRQYFYNYFFLFLSIVSVFALRFQYLFNYLELFFLISFYLMICIHVLMTIQNYHFILVFIYSCVVLSMAILITIIYLLQFPKTNLCQFN